ncbi:MAG TPA: dual specificity protein phosphatase [Roseiflexaceae bacterium]|nr:dual specificity protein phosphatase [Roseiflexaceae bacterium]
MTISRGGRPGRRWWLTPTWLRQYLFTQWQRLLGLNASRVTELLYVGGEFRAAQWPMLHSLGVRAVLSLQAERHDEFSGPPPARHLRVPVEDFHAPTIEQLQVACEFLEDTHRAGHPTLVHCHAGVGRAPLTAAAFLVTQGHSAAEAIERIAIARPIIGLNRRQLSRLDEWERFVRNTAAEDA